MKKLLVIVCVLLSACAQAANSAASSAKPLSAQAEISLLTCAAGQAIWTHYGHSALRVHDPARSLDLCFNYGLFNFNAPNFAARFISGHTDYMLGYTRTQHFIEDYRSEERSVYEQQLNLSAKEKEALWQALMLNARPENRVYRYNFFYDNCATRARKIIENNLDGRIVYDSTLLYSTLRASLKHYTASHPWADFGISFLIASEADQPTTFEALLYAPGEMQIAFQTAQVITQDSLGHKSERNLVKESRYLIEFPQSFTASSLETASTLKTLNTLKSKDIDGIFFLMLAFFALNLLLYIWEQQHHKIIYLADILLYLTAGLAGCVLCYLAFFSLHPAVHYNWLICWLQPLHLCYALALCIPAFRKSELSYTYPKVNTLLCIVMLIAAISVPQQIHPACWPLASIFVMRSIRSRHNKQQ